MQIDLTIKNYRSFPLNKPARLSLRKDITGFVGINNAGKSSLLRFFYDFRRLFWTLSRPGPDIIAALKDAAEPLQFSDSVADPEELFHNGNRHDLEIHIPFLVPESTEAVGGEYRMEVTLLREDLRWRARIISPAGPLDMNESNISFRGDKHTRLFVAAKSETDLSDLFKRCDALHESMYIGPFRNILNIDPQRDYFDIKVGQAFIRAWKKLKAGNKKQDNRLAIEVETAIRRLFGYGELRIDAADDDSTLQVYIDGHIYRLPELGAGIAQFIVVLANAAINRPSYILIDEPELNLHPSLQLDFLTTLASFARESTLFATHSLGLARTGADRPFSVRKLEGGSVISDLEATPSLPEFLGELSFSGYRELGFNKVFLVEGRTEIKTVQQLLRLWGKDHEVLPLPLGGGQMINAVSDWELEEIKRITPHVFALIDSERTSMGAPLEVGRQAFREACEKLDIRCHVLERRATENYLTERAVCEVKGDKYRALGHYESLKELTPAWGKHENWLIAREMTLNELRETDLGKFLDDICRSSETERT